MQRHNSVTFGHYRMIWSAVAAQEHRRRKAKKEENTGVRRNKGRWKSSLPRSTLTFEMISESDS